MKYRFQKNGDSLGALFKKFVKLGIGLLWGFYEVYGVFTMSDILYGPLQKKIKSLGAILRGQTSLEAGFLRQN